MYDSLTCVVKGSTDSSDYSDIFGTVCGYNDGSYCDGITANATTGKYGAYGMCNSTEQLAYVLNDYYQAAASSNKASACNFGGAAATKASSAGGSTCSALMAEAGTAGTGTVTSQPTGTGSGSSSGSSGGSSGSAASSASSSKGAGNMNVVPGVESGLLPVAFIATLAAISGMGMIVL